MNTNFWKQVAYHAQYGPSVALATIISHKGSTPQGTGNKLLIRPDSSIVGTIGGGALEFHVMKLGKEALEKNQSIHTKLNLSYDLGMCCGGIVEVFIEIIHPPDQLVIYGAGHVGMALAKIALGLDYQITMIESREEFTSPLEGVQYIERHPLDALESLPFGERCDHFITTHEHTLDQDILRALSSKKIRYLGMIGSHTKKKKFLMRFEAGEYDTSVFSRLHTPAGIDIGAKTPGEIAVSIAAQLIQSRQHCT